MPDSARLPARRRDEHRRAAVPDQRFAIIDYSVKDAPFTDASKGVTTPRNVRGLTFATNENSYMIGCLAA